MSPPSSEISSVGRTGASAEAIISHYDRGEDFFRLVLDPDLIYSCALFEGDEDLATAQRNKLDHHIDAAGAANVQRVLDIGCGWGAMLRRLVNRGVTEATGLTLSPSQANWIRKHSAPGVTVLEQDWRDHDPADRYDAIISIGAFEHFVQKGLPPARKLDAYREFFARCSDLLKPDGRISLQTIAYSQPHPGHPLLEKTFPDSELPLFWEPIAAAEGTVELVAMRNDRNDYYRTLKFWERNLLDNEAAAAAVIGPEGVQEFRRYLRLSALGFKTGVVGLLRMSFRKMN